MRAANRAGAASLLLFLLARRCLARSCREALGVCVDEEVASCVVQCFVSWRSRAIPAHLMMLLPVFAGKWLARGSPKNTRLPRPRDPSARFNLGVHSRAAATRPIAILLLST